MAKEELLDGVTCLGHSVIKFEKKVNDSNLMIYFDPFKLENGLEKADIIFITHAHYDHFSEDDILKIKKDSTIIVATSDLNKRISDLGFLENKIIIVNPNRSYEVSGIKFDTIPAYNIEKSFHPKENNWVGYNIDINGIKYFIAGDTDENEDNLKVKCNVAFIPVGGNFTMNWEEAGNFANKIKPEIAVPIHYGVIVGSMNDALKFNKMLEL